MAANFSEEKKNQNEGSSNNKGHSQSLGGKTQT